MALAPGTRIGVYEVTGHIGAGGMGEVYRATDSNLKRSVAIKVLPASVAGDVDRLARFQREAEVLAALNHPNIAAIYGLEKTSDVTALVMELVDGEDLSQRIARGAIPLDEALPIAKQIADALEVAHEQGIIHRDLKPANIKVRADGTVKVLDFGLAKAMDPAGGSSSDAMNSPTLSVHATMQGVILGTAAYMAPEQAKGRPVDKRADIWAFGVVLHEMLTRRRLFDAEDVSETLAAVLTRDVTLTSMPSGIPSRLRALLRDCLVRDPKQRLRDIGDARLVLDKIIAGVPDDAVAPVAVTAAIAPAWRRRLPWTLAAVAGAALATVLFMWAPWRVAPLTNVVTRFTFTLPEGQQFSRTGRRFVAISPDGSKVAYIANNQIYLRAMGRLTAQPLAGTNEDPLDLVFSPDSQWIAYFASPAAGSSTTFTLKKVAVSGGAPVKLCTTNMPFGSSWRNGTIVFGQNGATIHGIQAVADTGGTPRTVVTVDHKEEAWQPQLLDDGRHVIFTLKPAGLEGWDEADIVVQTIDGGARQTLVRGGSDVRMLPDGSLLYATGGNLLAVAFDARTLALRGGPVPVLEGVRGAGTFAGQFAVSDTGALVYVPDTTVTETAQRTLAWVDRQGHEQPIPAKPRAYALPRLSPDGTKVAVSSQDEQNDIWVFDLIKETLTRLTFGAEFDGYPVWTADGQSVIFRSGSTPRTKAEIMRKAADGAGSVEALTGDLAGGFPQSVSPDGKTLIFGRIGQETGLFVLPLNPKGPPQRLVPEGQRSGADADLSPDGRWIAYESAESGTREVYVRPFPNTSAGRWQVSSGGGGKPVWSHAGHELFFVGNDNRLMVAPIRTVPTFNSGKPQMVTDLSPYQWSGFFGRGFDVSADDKKFLMIKNPQATGPPERPSLTIVTHWFDELKTRVK